MTTPSQSLPSRGPYFGDFSAALRYWRGKRGYSQLRALPFLPLTLHKDGVELNMFTTITTMGTPHDVTVHELRLESFFPADEPSKQWFIAKNVA